MLLRSEQQRLGPLYSSSVDPSLVASISTGPLTLQAELVLSEHVVGGNVLLPGVGFVEMAFAHRDADTSPCLLAVAFVKPCLLSGPYPRRVARRTLRHTSQGVQTFEIASGGGAAVMGSKAERTFSMHVAGALGSTGAGGCMRHPDV